MGLVILIAAVVILAFLLWPRPKKPAPPRNPGIPVSIGTVTKGNIDVTLDELGTVTPTYTVTVESRVEGQLTEIHYKEGQLVKTGDLLCVIDPRPYQAAVDQADGQLARDQATLRNAKIDLVRYQNAYTQHAIPEQQLATQQATVDQDAATIKIDQANLESAQLNLTYTHITSPINGRVGLRLVDLGNLVSANGTSGLVTITQLQPITVIFTLAEDQIDEVATAIRAAGQKPLRVQALDRLQEHVLAEGTLLTLDNQINIGTGTVRARAVFPNKDNALFPNEFVNARLFLRTLQGVALLPTVAIQRNNDQATVYVVGPDGKATARSVKVTASEGENSAVTGVNPGDRVVTDGFDKLQNGSKVVARQRKAPAPKPASASE